MHDVYTVKFFEIQHLLLKLMLSKKSLICLGKNCKIPLYDFNIGTFQVQSNFYKVSIISYWCDYGHYGEFKSTNLFINTSYFRFQIKFVTCNYSFERTVQKF